MRARIIIAAAAVAVLAACSGSSSEESETLTADGPLGEVLAAYGKLRDQGSAQIASRWVETFGEQSEEQQGRGVVDFAGDRIFYEFAERNGTVPRLICLDGLCQVSTGAAAQTLDEQASAVFIAGFADLDRSVIVNCAVEPGEERTVDGEQVTEYRANCPPPADTLEQFAAAFDVDVADLSWEADSAHTFLVNADGILFELAEEGSYSLSNAATGDTTSFDRALTTTYRDFGVEVDPYFQQDLQPAPAESPDQ